MADDANLDDLREAHTRLATGADPEKTRAAMRHLAGTGITAADLEHIPATLTRLFTPHQENTMRVADLNGTHLGKTITVTTKHETITGTLWDVTHEASRITDERACAAPGTTTDVVGRIDHRLTIGAVDGSLPGDADVEVHP